MLSDKVRILDGGLSTALQEMGYKVDGDPLWSARCLYSAPDSISNAHLAYLNAGADILITSSYQASIDGFMRHLGISENEAVTLIRWSVSLAKEVRTQFLTKNEDRKILIAGSIGPYGACASNGSEYSGSYMHQISEKELMDWHRPRIEALIAEEVDFLAIETLPALGEATALLKLLKNYPQMKTWVSFSCKDGNSTNFGDDFCHAVKTCFDMNPKQLIAVGVNCSHPSHVTSLLRKAEQAVPGTLLPRVVYPNSGENWNSEKGWEGNPEDVVSYVKNEVDTWLSLGTRVIGGCCRVSPSLIQSIAQIVHSRV